MALIVILVGAILFQAYTSHVLADLKAAGTFDRYAQLQGERRAIANLVRESVLEYYERPRLGQPEVGLTEILNGYLASMKGASSIDYAAAVVGSAFPNPAKDAFWPNLDPSNIDGDVPVTGGRIHPISLPPDLAHSRIARYFDPGAKALSIQDSGGANDIFQIDVTRNGGTDGTDAVFHYYVRLFQVPVTDENLIAYGTSDKAANIPADPPELPDSVKTAIANRSISALALSKMNGPGATLFASSPNSYPFLFRELFSAASSLWEYVFYVNEDKTTHNAVNYASDLFPTEEGVYVLSDPYNLSGVTQGLTDLTNMNGSTGFDPDWRDAADNHVSSGGYRVDEDGNFLYNSPGVTVTVGGVTYGDTSPAGGDGIINEDLNWDGTGNTEGDAAVAISLGLAPAKTTPVKVFWTFDLDKIPDPTTGDLNFRRVYVHLPENLTGEPISTAANSTITITDTGVGTTSGPVKPVILCIEGWSRANNLINGHPYPDNFTVYLRQDGGKLADQQLMIYAVGTDLNVETDCDLDGAILLDDKLAGLSFSGKLNLKGLLAWHGGMSAPNVATPSVNVNSANLSVARLGSSAFRAVAPRFLVVDVQSCVTE
jgi:hypothetical protein